MKIKICTVVTGSNLKKFLKNLDKIQEVSEMIELRVDKIKNLREKDLQLIRKNTIKEAIFTSRIKKIILKAFDLEFDFVDIDFSLITNFDLSKSRKTKIIVSFHDFEKTPSLILLKNIKKKMKQFQPDVMKFATMVNSGADIVNLFKLLLNKSNNEEIIVIGMGEKGKITRVLGPLLGSFLMYASTPYGKTASGQIDIMELKKIYQLIN
ncbi:hypothetical protein COS31_00620 [Candidatus Roizmanbacteria bacterium CG02_land_8_20_14_3_00_36_15]|uniref:3-dehydroquinate dehydratase n=4 Tax=Candidatus Roizmaniibacteriota TaxID=1752723 RepID=A0A2M7BVH2_9BACT|nr:MAG: hypothetical protein COV86_03135 [Candidatus Roizmanbacteria bacterium CG11_big_fil_rev_8_21_14_0_20_35_14]PIV10573.1 MAG: hypothetical protein COS50_04710 [Candidatus Roizmanbacteria bacterium CG03_land_8_20_14_0_80_35_26]PIV38210.1 MAG: hypothetical protein COS31_00620 [Candidatus Roizmanbacteria bacterium CG02_land_8_20_14_3_00_36_15]PIZ68558.1 MAG: hypothetical protein COY13_00935 [Candidatus Roizmanbacteria bacterium CG_4_10_14_0_2_um_filter_36_35]PJC31678.1 MAG: hypothetical prote